MRPSKLHFVALIVLFSCTNRPNSPAPNRWADTRLWPVLEAQEKRDTYALCDLLKDSSATTRSAAALAFASVQDSASIPCLIAALSDTVNSVRVNAIFALGFIANESTLDRMAELSDDERDSTLNRTYLSALFLNLQRRGKFNEVQPILYYLERSSGQERMRAADALRRLTPASLRKDSTLALRVLELETDPEVKALLTLALAPLLGPGKQTLLLRAGTREQPLPLRIAAMQTLGPSITPEVRDSLFAWVNDPIPAIRTAAIDALHNGGVFSGGGSYWSVTKNDRWFDPLTLNRLRGLMAYNRKTQKQAVVALRADTATDPYAEAERMKALSMVDDEYRDPVLEKLLFGDHHPALRQAAFGIMADRNVWAMIAPRALSGHMQVMQAAPFWHRVFSSGDPGLICAAAEKLAGPGDRELKLLLPTDVEEKAIAALHPLRDLEARILLKQLAATRDGLSAPTATAPPFNHPIDPVKLRALKQGQRYRIMTNKGDIIIATDVDQCPGSSLAFDSLVTAGYYSEKAFHRMVPNFVVQGGCPRGDGYGGMPWTLRTEIGCNLFTAGSVGLASAGRDTESCQFFITHSATPHLDGRYTRFGEVVEGMDVVWRLQVGDVMERVQKVE